jgi:hypothetical protein
MNDDELFEYFFARLQGNEMPMACASMDCECLSILEDDQVSKAVASYLVWFEKKSKHEQDLILMEWYRYARNIGVVDNKTNYYQVPFDGELVNHPSLRSKIIEHKLCQSGMQRVMSVGDTRMRTIRQAAQFGSIPPRHQGKDRVAHNAITKNDPRFKSLKEHFDIMMNLGEVRATRVVATMVDGVAGRANRDDTTEMVFLPISMGYRNCYKRYMAGNGYKVRSNQKGAIIVEAGAEGGEREGKESIVSIATYFNFWKREYPHLKICRPAEDIMHSTTKLVGSDAQEGFLVDEAFPSCLSIVDHF